MNCLLVMNAGSSSVKFGLYEDPGSLMLASGVVRNIGQPGATMSISLAGHQTVTEPSPQLATTSSLGAVILHRLRQMYPDAQITGIAHRVVHGGPTHVAPEVVTPQLITDLHRIESLDPNHLPAQIELMYSLGQTLPEATQVACFDTAFHANLPAKARILPIPRRYTNQGVRKFGFHGLALQSVVDQLAKTYPLLPQKIIVAHLGSGVSITALQDGASIDTSMALSPNSGVPMSTRRGNIDPGIFTYITATDKLSTEAVTDILANKSGLLGISDQTPDMERLLADRDTNPMAAEAIDVFCYEVSKQIAAMTVALGGLDLLVFSGGMGEVAGVIRGQVCQQLAHLSLRLDDASNQSNATVLSTTDSSVQVRIVQVDEASVMLQQIKPFISKPQPEEAPHANIT